ncbi:MAG: hypothetical protein V9E98_14835 [Candidatus Nanopelagicales bacterium]
MMIPVWFNGWVTPDDHYVATVQSANTTQSFVEEHDHRRCFG